MTADEFVESVRAVTPTLEMLVAQGFTATAADWTIAEYLITPRSKAIVMGYKVSALFTELFARYDLTKLRVYMVSFLDKPILEGRRAYFGYEDGVRLFVDIDTGEVRDFSFEDVLSDWAYAGSFDEFMAALLVVAEFMGRVGVLGADAERVRWGARATTAAGGLAYARYWCYRTRVPIEAVEAALHPPRS